MKPAIVIDFLAPERELPRAGVVLLAVALAALALSAWQYAALRAEAGVLATRLEALRGASAPRAPGPREGSPQAAAELVRAQAVLQRLAAPWNGLFAGIERAVGGEVALLAIQPDVARARVTLDCEARNLREALAFAERLNRGGVLAEAILGGHEVRAQDPHRPVRFTLQARWLAAEARP
jgi:Tfp pilus assembly protein PilN